MRIGILRFNQKREEKPWLHTSKTKAKVLVESGFFEWISKSIILELVENTILKKDPAKEYGSKVKVIPRLLPPLLHEGCLNLAYPVRDMTSYRKEFGYYQNWSTFRTELPKLERIDV
jgi:hypothetical protein